MSSLDTLSGLPENVLQQIISQLKFRSDLVNLSSVNKLLNHFANQRLYSDIIILDKTHTLLSNYLKMSILSPIDLASFIKTLKSNKQLPKYVQNVLVAEKFSSHVELQELVDVLLEFKTSKAEFQLQGLKKFVFLENDHSFLQMNRDFLRSYNFKNKIMGLTPLYENDEDAFTNYNRSNKRTTETSALMKYQIFEANDLTMLNDGFTSLMVSIFCHAPSYTPTYDQSVVNNMNNLQELEISNPHSFVDFFKIMRKNNILFKNLRSLSLTLMNMNLFPLLINSINFHTIESLDLKLSQPLIQEDNHEINLNLKSFFNDNLNSLKKLSIVNLGPDQLNNRSLQRKFQFTHSDFLYCLLTQSMLFNDDNNVPEVKYLNFCLNSFPLLKTISTDMLDENNSLIVDDDYLSNKIMLFEKLLRFKVLETLIIPDYLFNWKPFLKFSSKGDVSISDSLDATKYLLNTCHCDNCNITRILFEQYSKEFQRIYNGPSYFYLYNFIVGLLFRRIPELGKRSGLDINQLPFMDSIVVSHYNYLNMEFEKLFILVLHNLKDDFKFFFTNFPNLRELCLGGLLVKGEKINNGSLILRAVYDDWSSEIVV